MPVVAAPAAGVQAPALMPVGESSGTAPAILSMMLLLSLAGHALLLYMVGVRRVDLRKVYDGVHEKIKAHFFRSRGYARVFKGERSQSQGFEVVSLRPDDSSAPSSSASSAGAAAEAATMSSLAASPLQDDAKQAEF